MSASFSHRRRFFEIVVSATIFLPMFAATYYAAFLLRFAGSLDETAFDVLLGTLPWVLTIQWTVFAWFGIYQSWTRYVSFHDLLVLGKAITASTVGITLLDALCLPNLQIPRSVLLIDWGVTLVVIGSARALPRLIRDDGWRLFYPRVGVPSLIVGANDSGETLLRAIRSNPALNYRIVGFVDDRREVRRPADRRGSCGWQLR